MAARPNSYMSREIEGYSASFSLKRFHNDVGAAVPVRKIEVGETKDPEEALTCPDPNHSADIGKRRKLGNFEVDVDPKDGSESKGLVKMEERLIKSMTNDRR